MKIEQVIVLHLFNHKKVALQGIGTFTLDPSVSVPADMEKEIVIPEGAVSFEYNPKVTEDDLLIDSIVKYTTKIKPLASADLDSFLMLGRQFLNIGKPFTLDKLGTLDKAQTGELVFIPGQFITPKIEAPKALKENENEESSGLFNDYNREPENNNRSTVAIVATIAGAVIIGWAIYHFAFAKKEAPAKPANTQEQAATITDTTTIKDTVAMPVAPAVIPAATASQDSSFNAIIRQTNSKKEAQIYFTKLTTWGHHLVMYTNDSIHFTIAEVIKLPLSDTTRVRDSLSRFYNTKVIIEKK